MLSARLIRHWHLLGYIQVPLKNHVTSMNFCWLYIMFKKKKHQQTNPWISRNSPGKILDFLSLSDSGPRSLLLASERLDPNCRDDRGDTALHLAAGNGERGACELLLKHRRVDRSLQDEDGRTVEWRRKIYGKFSG